MSNINSLQDAINECAKTGRCVVMECIGDYGKVDLKGCQLERNGVLVYVCPR